MSVYYNEIDPYAAEWLHRLMIEGMIAPGYVDTRSIEDVTPNDLAGYTQCHFFAGIGVWSYALRLAGWPDDRPVWTGSCPCQPFSAAGKGGGFADERHLWPAWFHLITQCQPATLFGEQVASPAGLGWFDLVSADLEASNYAVGAVDTCAAGVGAPHVRQRLYFTAVAHSKRNGLEGVCVAGSREREKEIIGERFAFARTLSEAPQSGHQTGTESMPEPMAHGASARVGRLRAYGNAIVAPLAAEFIGAYLDC